MRIGSMGGGVAEMMVREVWDREDKNITAVMLHHNCQLIVTSADSLPATQLHGYIAAASHRTARAAALAGICCLGHCNK
eukprot:842906-Pyramimonas_sp.AAC.1